jgi:predicted alpha/beta-fold hydrolase
MPTVSRDAALGALAGASTSTLTLLALVRRYVQRELTLPTLIHGEDEDSPQARQLLLEVRLLLRDYWPHPVLEFSGYASSAWMGLWVALLAHRQHPGRLEELTLRDGGTVSLCWAEPPGETHHKRVAVLFPGLCNDSRTYFMGATMRHLRAEGFQAVTFNYRGTGGVRLTSARSGSFDSWEDVPEVVAHIEAQCPGHDLFAVGFSMGSAILLRHLGETGTSCRFRAAVAVAAATDLTRVSASLKWPPKKLFLNAMMTSGLKLMAIVNGIHRSEHFRPFAKSFFLATTLEGVDDVLTAPMNGYKNGKEFSALNSPHLTLHKVAVPTLILNSQDDPITSVKDLSLSELRRNPHFYVVLTRRGGHIGWGTGGHGGSVSWTDRMAAHFLKSCESGRTVVDIAAEDDQHGLGPASREAEGTEASSLAPRSRL